MAKKAEVKTEQVSLDRVELKKLAREALDKGTYSEFIASIKG